MLEELNPRTASHQPYFSETSNRVGLKLDRCHLQSSYFILDEDILEFLIDRDVILLGQQATSPITLILKTELGLSRTPCHHQETDSA